MALLVGEQTEENCPAFKYGCGLQPCAARFFGTQILVSSRNELSEIISFYVVCLCGLIVRVRVVPRRTVVGDIDRRFDNLSGGYHQSNMLFVSGINMY